MEKLSNSLRKAFLHVKSFYPTVAIVIFDSSGRWQYMDANFESFKFDDRIDVSILQDAADSIDRLPAIIEFPQQNYYTITIKTLYCTKVQIEADTRDEAELKALNLPIKTREELDFNSGQIIDTSIESDTVPINILETFLSGNSENVFSKNKFNSLTLNVE